jgi:hypothetical protein
MIFKVSIKSQNVKRVFGKFGLILWSLIIPIKLGRYFNWGIFGVLNDNLPSFLGASGLFLVLLSNKGKLSRLTVIQCGLIASAVAVLIELVQFIVFPGILSYPAYTFDLLDILFGILSIAITYLIILLLYSKNIFL